MYLTALLNRVLVFYMCAYSRSVWPCVILNQVHTPLSCLKAPQEHCRYPSLCMCVCVRSLASACRVNASTVSAPQLHANMHNSSKKDAYTVTLVSTFGVACFPYSHARFVCQNINLIWQSC